MQEEKITIDLIEKLRAEKKSAIDFQARKHEDWNDNYELSRNKVKTNRLTQRQAVNIPLMKETEKTILSKIDDAPTIDWKELGGDENKEIIFQEIWNASYNENKLELVDILDKKNVIRYGLGTKKLNISDSGIAVDSLDVFDIVFDPMMKAGDIETARFILNLNIFKSVREILADDRYTVEGKQNLKVWQDSPAGIVQSEEARKQWAIKMERIREMGLSSSEFALYAGGDRVVNLTEHYTTHWNEKKMDWERRVAVYADDSILLLDETLESLIGVDFWPFVVWSEDPETNDIYPDSISDLVRTPNKVLNVWFSQMLENRTLKNFQMHWFLPSEGYTPQTYTPGPGVMLPAPPGDDINKVIKPVEVNGLDDTMLAIQALTTIVERATGATAVDKGQSDLGAQTLGEVQILVGKSVERAVGMAKFYRMAWYELATKWCAMMHANAPKVLKLYKTSRTGKIYTKKIYASDWKSAEGYEPIVASSSEQEQDSIKTLQKFMFLLQQFPENLPLKKIAQKRMLESVNLSPDELKQIESFGEEQQVQAQQPQQQQAPQQEMPQAPQQPQPAPQDTGEIADLINQLSA